jgi:hypothetical protein
LWLLTIFAWISHALYLKRKYSINNNNTKHQKFNNHYLALMAACKQNNAEQALALILPWLNNLNINNDNVEISTLVAATAQIDNDEFTRAINNIQQHLYGKETLENPWVGEELLKLIQQINASSTKNSLQTNFTLNPN